MICVRHRKRGASCRTTRTRSRRGRASEYVVNLGGHDEVVLMQSLDLLGLQRDCRIAPTKADIRMMAFARIRLANCEGECCGAGAVRLNHPRRDLVRSMGVCPASPPTPWSRAGALF